MNSFVKAGNASYCLINYQLKTVQCFYNTMEECKNELGIYPSSICVPRKALKLKGDN